MTRVTLRAGPHLATTSKVIDARRAALHLVSYRRCGPRAIPAQRERVAMALYNRGAALAELSRPVDEVVGRATRARCSTTASNATRWFQ